MKKMISLFLVVMMLFAGTTSISAMEKPVSESTISISPRTAHVENYEYNFQNYVLTPRQYVMTNGGISIRIESCNNLPNHTVTYELVRNGGRTGMTQTVPLVNGSFVSWGELQSGYYQIRITSTKADLDTHSYCYLKLRVIFGD